MPISQPALHPSFDFIRSVDISSLKLTLQEYQHRQTGAVHYHMATDSTENVFAVALRTVPADSTGVAHILEHTSLCGSKNFPVRDPFFMMLRRSLNSFMNAFTSSDWTAYPFATTNRKDFDNLLRVYLDAVFFARLDPLDFAQEGHRLEFEEPDNSASPLQFKGVVFNEMKGAMSSVSSVLWQALTAQLFPTTTYHYNSGGDPAHIPDLSYADLTAFYKVHYHPGNAIIMTYGNIPANEHHQRLEELALGQFSAAERRIDIPAEQRFVQPKRVQDYYATEDQADDASAENLPKTHVVLGWLWGQSANLQDFLEAHLLSAVLLDNGASPLRLALETSKLGQAPSPLCGLEDSNREMVFACGLEACAADASLAVEQLVLETLQQVATQGVELSEVEAVLHQLELHQREISGDSHPYGLQLILQAMGSAVHRGDPFSVLNLEPVLAELRLKIRQPDYIPGLVRRLLLANGHRVTLTMQPDATLAGRREEAEQQRLVQLREGLDDTAISAIIAQAGALKERQLQVDDPDILPKVGLADVPAEQPEAIALKLQVGKLALTRYNAGTNGLVYQQALLKLPELSAQEADLLPLYCQLVTETGLAGKDYLSVQKRQAACVGSINAYYSLRGGSHDEQDVAGFVSLSSKALVRNHRQQTELMLDTLTTARFDEHSRIGEIIAQTRARRDQGITGNGHSLAMLAASSGFSPVATFSHHSSGLSGILKLRHLDDATKDPQFMESLGADLQALHQKLGHQELQLLEIGEAEQAEHLHKTLTDYWGHKTASAQSSTFTLPPVRQAARQIWQANTQVSFCAIAYPTVAMCHPDAAALTVLGGFLRNGFLHRAIREQGGAYGAGAAQESNYGCFRFFSYRDPRLEETLADFQQSLDWLQQETHSPQALEEAILGVISSMDKPHSPAGEARSHFYMELFGRSHAMRQTFRQQVLATSLADLQRVAAAYFTDDQRAVAIVTHAKGVDELAAFSERYQPQLIKL